MRDCPEREAQSNTWTVAREGGGIICGKMDPLECNCTDQLRDCAEQEAQSNAYLQLMPLALPAPPVAGGAPGFGGAPAGFGAAPPAFGQPPADFNSQF